MEDQTTNHMDNPKYRPFVRAKLDGAGTLEAAREAGYANTPSQYAINLFKTAADMADAGREPEPAEYESQIEDVNERMEALRAQRRELKRRMKAAEILRSRSEAGE